MLGMPSKKFVWDPEHRRFRAEEARTVEHMRKRGRSLCKRSGGSAKNDLQCQDRERTAQNRSQRSTTGSQPRTHDLGPQRRSHRHGQPRSDSPRTTIPACMGPNDAWGRVCAWSRLDRLLGLFVN